MPTFRQPVAWGAFEEFLDVGTATEAVAEGDLAAGDSVSTVFYDASAGSLTFKRAAGSSLAIGSFTELLTIDAAASTMSSTYIPGDVMMLAISVYVVATIPDALVFTVTTEVTGFSYALAGSVSADAGSSDQGNSGCPQVRSTSSAQRVVITPFVTPSSNAGRVRIAAYWLRPMAPTA